MSKFEKEKSLPKVVVKFTATWCGPCRDIAPVYKELATKYKNIKFLEVDVDKGKEIKAAYNINCMPSFVFLKDGTEIRGIRMEGANEHKLRQEIGDFSK